MSCMALYSARPIACRGCAQWMLDREGPWKVRRQDCTSAPRGRPMPELPLREPVHHRGAALSMPGCSPIACRGCAQWMLDREGPGKVRRQDCTSAPRGRPMPELPRRGPVRRRGAALSVRRVAHVDRLPRVRAVDARQRERRQHIGPGPPPGLHIGPARAADARAAAPGTRSPPRGSALRAAAQL